MYETTEDFVVALANEHLVGFTITAAEVDGGLPVLTLRRGKEERQVVLQADEEANGPGYLVVYDERQRELRPQPKSQRTRRLSHT